MCSLGLARTLIAAVLAICTCATTLAGPHGTSSIAELWEPPTRLHDATLFYGSWGAADAPDPNAIYTFIRRKENGANPGMIVRDPIGRLWHVKQGSSSRGDEGPVEVVLSRILSAVGYHQPPVYFLRSFTMADHSRTREEPGGRFRLDLDALKDRGPWSWRNNPFVESQPYKGLLVILLLFNSWDLKDSNNTLYEVHRQGRVDRWYVVRDLGGALGETGRLRPRRNDIEKFERHRFITGVDKHGYVDFAYGGKQESLVRDRITVDDVRWATDLLQGISERQWSDAFRAGGYDTRLSERFIQKLRANIVLAHDVGNQP